MPDMKRTPWCKCVSAIDARYDELGLGDVPNLLPYARLRSHISIILMIRRSEYTDMSDARPRLSRRRRRERVESSGGDADVFWHRRKGLRLALGTGATAENVPIVRFIVISLFLQDPNART
jgi:hypothetical protein